MLDNAPIILDRFQVATGRRPRRLHFTSLLHFPVAQITLRCHHGAGFLKPACFAASTNSWTFPDSYILDTDTNLRVMQIDHFTDVALVARGDTMCNIYLPAIIR